MNTIFYKASLLSVSIIGVIYPAFAFAFAFAFGSFMRNVLAIVVAVVIGYAIGWYQFSDTSDNAGIDSTAKNLSGTSFGISEDNTDRQQNNVDTVLGIVDNKQVSDAVEGLAKIENINYTDLASLVLSPTVDKVSSIIDNMTESEIYLALGSVTSFNEKELKEISNPSLFARRLLSTALFKEDAGPGSSKLSSVDFGVEVRSDNSVKEAAALFRKNVGRLYASFAMDDQVDHVFIKWFQNSPYKLRLFNKYEIDKEKRHNFVWYNPHEWGTGLYTVEVYALDANLTRLASGSFRIEE